MLSLNKNELHLLSEHKPDLKTAATHIKKSLKKYTRKISGTLENLSVRRAIHHLIWVLKGVKVHALVGRSGTGKSFRAQLVAQKYGIDLIIDDGLLIKEQKILAGRSAKKEKSRLAAARIALFMIPEHREEVQRVFEKEKFKRVLIVGTSEEMVRKITHRIGLPAPQKIIKIEEISTEAEIRAAINARNNEGKHVIPAPAVEVKGIYPQIFFESVRIFLRKSLFFKRKDSMIEKSIVKPHYAQGGQISISRIALSQMVFHCVKEFDNRLNITRILVEKGRYSYKMEVVLEIPYGLSVADNMSRLQSYIMDNIEKYAGLTLDEVNITVGNLEN